MSTTVEKATDTVDKLILAMVMAQRIARHMPKVPEVDIVTWLSGRPQWGWPDIREKS